MYLNLDHVVAAVVARRDEDVLRPIFHATHGSEDIIRDRLTRDMEQCAGRIRRIARLLFHLPLGAPS